MKKALLVLAVAVPFVVIGTVGVWQLSGNNDRRLGAITATDKPVALSWRGAWSGEATYTPGQAVSHGAGSYVAEMENANSEPDPGCARNCAWAVMAASGGPQGETGPKGDPGAKGETGPKGDQGAAGPATDTLTGSIVVPSCPAGNYECKFAGPPQGFSTGLQAPGIAYDWEIYLQNHPFAITTPAVAADAALLAANTTTAPGSANGFDRGVTLYIMVVPNGPVLPCLISGTAKSCTGAAPPSMTIPAGSRVVATVSASAGYPGGRIDFGWRLG